MTPGWKLAPRAMSAGRMTSGPLRPERRALSSRNKVAPASSSVTASGLARNRPRAPQAQNSATEDATNIPAPAPLRVA